MKLTKQLIVTLIEEIILESIRNKMKPIRTARAHEIVQWDLWTLLKSLENIPIIFKLLCTDSISKSSKNLIEFFLCFFEVFLI